MQGVSPSKQFELPEDILQFWFDSCNLTDSRLNSLEYIQDRMKLWFARANHSFEACQRLNAELVTSVSELNPGNWSNQNAISLLAKIILYDQFPRCIWRGTSRAFAYDHFATDCIIQILELDLWSQFQPVHRLFIILALQHSEEMKHQELAASIIGNINSNNNNPEVVNFFVNLPGFHTEHYDVMKRFNRFPGRNDAMNRESTPEEIAFLNSPECPNWCKSQQKAKGK
jgi:uncharacterized protein (DUF924 family)